MSIVTIGHGTLAAEDLAALVRDAGVDLLVDVRRHPGSRRHPQFGRDAMAAWLPAGGVAYRWEPALGGRRSGAPDSPNTALRNPQFRAYADHMGTAEFVDAVRVLLDDDAATDGHVAVLCSESVWWRCHRRLLADHLVLVDGVGVDHVFHDGRTSPHPPTPEARVDHGRLVYDAGQLAL